MKSSIRSSRVGILSVGMGNIAAIEGALRRLCIESIQVTGSSELFSVSHLIIPGVGAMGEFMNRVKANGLIHDIRSFAGYGKILGICLGFQSLYSYSQEGNCDCLALLDGEVKSIRDCCHISTNVGYLKVLENRSSPQLSMNIIRSISSASGTTPASSHRHSQRLEYYFTHSYFVPVQPTSTHIAHISPNLDITAVSSNGKNICGTQFHPELSHSIGRSLISSFLSQ